MTIFVKIFFVKMENLGETIKKLRLEKNLPLRIASAHFDIDQAILSKIERGHRKASRDLVTKLADYYNVNQDGLMVTWLSDNIVYEIKEEELALEALQLAEKKIKYISFKKINREDIIKQLNSILSYFSAIQTGWIYGSFSRGDDTPESDIDLAINAEGKFSYFDLAEVQFKLEKLINRKVDIGFIDSFKPYILNNIKPDLKLIYEKSSS